MNKPNAKINYEFWINHKIILKTINYGQHDVLYLRLGVWLLMKITSKLIRLKQTIVII